MAIWSGRAALGRRTAALAGAVLIVMAAATAGCGGAAQAAAKPGVISAVGAENEYANVLSQIGGRYVSVSAILSNPNTDPHTFESSPSVARDVSGAQLIVQNGVGYDDFMGKIESASPKAGRKVIVAQDVLGLPDDTPNPHLWYSPKTMPAVAKVMAADLSAIQPRHAAYFAANLQRFDASLQPWLAAIAAFKDEFGGVAVAVTEPVADYLLQAMGTDDVTPFAFQADVMNGVDPAPQDISLENGFFTMHEVKVFCYNRQVVDGLTESILHNAQHAGVPVVGVYETMPTGDDYQSWMLSAVQDIEKAVAGSANRRAAMTVRAEDEDEILTVEGLGVTLSGRPILKDVSFTVRRGEFTGMIGSNGAGKTTLLRTILGLQRPTTGSVAVQGGHGPRHDRSVGYVPQKVLLDPDIPMRARDLVALGIDGHRFGVPMRSRRQRADAVDAILDAVDAERFADDRVGQLSGGEQQRVMIAHALISRPQLLLLDEPLANLDLRSSHEIIALLRRIATEQQVAVLLSAHEINPLLAAMDRVVYIAGGHAVSGVTRDVIRADVLSRLYGYHVDVLHVHGHVLVVAGQENDDATLASDLVVGAG